MMSLVVAVLFFLFLGMRDGTTTSSVVVVVAWPDKEVTSREYKTLLKASLFGDNEKKKSHAEVLQELQHDLTLAAAASGATGTSGAFALDGKTPRYVRYLDTPGTCHLRSNSWYLRLRQSLENHNKKDDEEDNQSVPWEGTLKFRNGDRYYTDSRRKHMDECHPNYKEGSGKLEEDIPHFDWTGNKFSFGQKCEIPHVSTLTSLQHVVDVWYEMEKNIEGLEWDLEAELKLVSNLTMVEVRYKHFRIDFDSEDDDGTAQLYVALRYHSEDYYKYQISRGNATTQIPHTLEPLLAEMSLRIKSKKENWSDETVLRAHDFWDRCSQLDKWLHPESSTKTAWVYRYDPAFCNPDTNEGEST